ncbi:MAG: hypothetical protein H7Z14_12570 [Anaerolineae bacterium]|nr:hypothetical protein [Phycisphaerae bacterium]
MIRWQLITLTASAAICVLAAIAAYRMSWLADPLTCAVPLVVAYAMMLVIARQARTIR